MIGITFAVLLMLGAAIAEENDRKPFEGVDPNTLSCDPEGQVFLLLPHFTDCSKFFMCAHGKEVEFPCNGGLIFDFELQGCNWEHDTTCILRNPREDIDVEGSGSGEESGDFEWLAYAESPQHAAPSAVHRSILESLRPAAASPSPFSAVLDCSRAESAARQVPYKGDCQRYWRCVSGVPQSVYCTDGLFFNEKTMQCDFEANAKCEVAQDDELQGEFIVYN